MRIRGCRLGLAVLTLMGTLAGATVLLGQNVAGGTTPGGTLYVTSGGTDTGTCRLSAHPCATITYAISQADANAKINVGAGTYAEQFTIPESLTIVGVTGQTIIQPTSLSPVDTDPNHSSTPYPIVDVASGVSGVVLKDLTIDGSQAQSTFTSCSQDPMGVYFHNASGELKKVTVSNIAETAPTNGSLFGCQVGIGVYAASNGGSSNVILQHDTITGYQKDGVACRDTTTSCYVNNSTVTGVGPSPYQGANGIEVYGAAVGSVVGNTVTANSYTTGGAGNQATGLLLLDDGELTATGNTLSGNDINAYLGSDGSGPHETGWTFSGNTVTGATDGVAGGAPGYGNGVDVDGPVNLNITVSQNTVTHSAGGGIVLTGASHLTVSDNTTNNNQGDGIYVGGPGGVWGGPAPTTSSNVTVSGNTSKNNGSDGIHADTDSSGSTFSGNTTKNNLRYDLEDAGTGNTWSSNGCTPAADSSPSGLCS